MYSLAYADKKKLCLVFLRGKVNVFTLVVLYSVIIGC